MRKLLKRFLCLAALALLGGGVAPARAGTFSGTIFYTNFAGSPNVNSVSYNYNDSTKSFTLGAATPIASPSGADGIIFAPNGNLLIGGAGTPAVHEITTGGAPVTDHSTGGQP